MVAATLTQAAPRRPATGSRDRTEPTCGFCPICHCHRGTGRTLCPVRGVTVLPQQVCLLRGEERAALVTLLAAHLGVARGG